MQFERFHWFNHGSRGKVPCSTNMVIFISLQFCIFWGRVYETINPLAHVGYEMINEWHYCCLYNYTVNIFSMSSP